MHNHIRKRAKGSALSNPSSTAIDKGLKSQVVVGAKPPRTPDKLPRIYLN